jgi:hypothetical protein
LLPAIALAASALLGGCVAYPAYGYNYGYGYGSYAYAPAPYYGYPGGSYVAFGFGGDHGWHDGGGWYHDHDGGWHH